MAEKQFEQLNDFDFKSILCSVRGIKNTQDKKRVERGGGQTVFFYVKHTHTHTHKHTHTHWRSKALKVSEWWVHLLCLVDVEVVVVT